MNDWEMHTEKEKIDQAMHLIGTLHYCTVYMCHFLTHNWPVTLIVILNKWINERI